MSGMEKWIKYRAYRVDGIVCVFYGRMVMIYVLVAPDRIRVSGHANTAPKGSDIVCAAVSALTLTLIRGLKEIAGILLYESVESGNICIEWQTMNDTGKALIDTWFLGICGVAENCPCINFIDE